MSACTVCIPDQRKQLTSYPKPRCPGKLLTSVFQKRPKVSVSIWPLRFNSRVHYATATGIPLSCCCSVQSLWNTSNVYQHQILLKVRWLICSHETAFFRCLKCLPNMRRDDHQGVFSKIRICFIHFTVISPTTVELLKNTYSIWITSLLPKASSFNRFWPLGDSGNKLSRTLMSPLKWTWPMC